MTRKKAFGLSIMPIVGVIMIIITTMINNSWEYTKYEVRECIVVDRLPDPGRYSSNYYLILREKSTGRLFDLSVSPTSYTQAYKGKKVYFNLRGFDIKQTSTQNIGWFFIPVAYSFGITFMIFGIIMVLYYSFKK